jgi:hypothetical protein
LSNKRTRRNLRRIAERKGIEYKEAIEKFYGKKISKLDKHLLWSLYDEKVKIEVESKPVSDNPNYWMH